MDPNIAAKIESAVFWMDATPMTREVLATLLLNTLEGPDLGALQAFSVQHGEAATKDWLCTALHQAGIPLGLLVLFLS